MPRIWATISHEERERLVALQERLGMQYLSDVLHGCVMECLDAADRGGVMLDAAGRLRVCAAPILEGVGEVEVLRAHLGVREEELQRATLLTLPASEALHFFPFFL